MGRVIAKQIRGMSWTSKVSLVLACTLLMSVFMYEGLFKPDQGQAAIGTTTGWTTLATSYHTATKTPSANIPVGGTASTGRVLVVGVTYVGTAAGTATCSATYGGTALTQAAGDTAAASAQSHTWLFYLPENNTLMDGTAKALATTVTSSTTALMTDGYYMVLNGVDQLNPLGSSARPTANKTGITGTSNSTGLTAGSGLLTNANEQAVAIYGTVRAGSTSSCSLASFLTNWTNTQNQTSTTSQSNHSYVNIRTIPASNLAEELCSFTPNNSSDVTSVSAASFRAGPSITSASPGSAAPGTANLDVTITGSNFVNPSSATFSGTGITVNSTSYTSATALVANITVDAAAASGLRNITVTGANGTTTGSNLFSIVSASAPTIATVAPAALGQGATSANVVITGSNFNATSTITVSGTGVSAVTSYVDATHLNVAFTVSAAATIGARDLIVTNSSDGSSSTKAGALTINTRPTVTSGSPLGMALGATGNVTITGTGFVTGAVASFSGTGVTVNSTAFVSATTLTANVAVDPAAAGGARTITVTNPDFGNNSGGSLTVLTAPAPTITSMTPSAVGRGATNVPFTITGTNFVTGATVARSGSSVTLGTMTVLNSTTITGTITSVSGNGTSTITVTNPDTQAATSTLTLNTYPSTPTILPASGSVGQTMDVVVASGSLVNGATVSFSGTGITVNSTTFNSSSQLTANITIAPAATAGARSVTVTNPDLGTRTASSIFTVSSVAVQAVSTGVAQGATGNITITGQGFTAAATVTVSGTGVTVNSVSYVSATTLNANVTVDSSVSAGVRDITVTVGTNSGTGTGLFTITAGPSITSLSPASLRQGQVNQDVTINGANFASGCSVQFNGTGVTLNSASYLSATQLTANVTIDQNAPLASQTVSVTNPDGGKATGGPLTVLLTGKTITGGVSFTQVTNSSIAMVIAYSGDGDSDGSCSVAYGATPALELGTVAATRGSGVYSASFTGLQGASEGVGKLYYFRVSFADGDGVIGSSQVYATQPTKGSQLLHNSQNTFSSKWSQGWGIDGGKYGAFLCSTCHNAATTNSKLVANSIQSPSLENWSSAGNSNTLNVVLRTTLGDDSAHATSTNVCEACHSRTNHHKYANPGANHQGAADCLACHSHNEGFLPSCIGCHASAQGANSYRRQVVGNGGDYFGNMSTHGKLSVINSQTCTVCHDSTSHQNFSDGVSVALKNADTGAQVVFDGTVTSAAATATVCISCHDADGATRLGSIASAPFAASQDFRAPANISQYWPAATGAHNTKMVCFNCHGNSNGVDGSTTNPKYNGHASGNKHGLQDKAYDVVNPNSYCFNCHNASSTDPNKSAKNISGQFALANKHVTAKCFDCHGDENNSLDSLHSLKSGSQTAGSGVIANNISNATGRSLTWSITSWGGATASANLASNTVSGEYQVCFKCHAATGTGTKPDVPGAGTAAASLTNLALEFNPNNASGHPVVTGLNNYPNSAAPKALVSAKMKAPWNVNLGTQVMACSDCHATDSAASKGPHGSSVKWMLAGTNKAWPYTTAAGNGGSAGTLRSMGNYNTGDGTKDGLFCLNCHVVTGTNSFHTQIANFSDEHSSTSGPAMCANCHIRVPHGGKMARLLQTTNAPARYKADGNATTPMFASFGHTGVPVKGAAYSGNFMSGSCSHHSTSGGEAW